MGVLKCGGGEMVLLATSYSPLFLHCLVHKLIWSMTSVSTPLSTSVENFRSHVIPKLPFACG